MSKGELPLEPSGSVEGTSADDQSGDSGVGAAEADSVPGRADEAGERWEPL